MFGLPEQVLKLMLDYFHSQSEIVKVIVYGSRAMGRESTSSDIDLAIVVKSKKDISRKVQMDLDELSTPYLFDVVDYERIENHSLKDHIDRVGKVLYSSHSG